MVGDTKIMSSRNDAGTAVVARPHMEQLVARTRLSGITARWQPGPDERAAALREIRGPRLGAHDLSWRRASGRWPRPCGTGRARSSRR